MRVADTSISDDFGMNLVSEVQLQARPSKRARTLMIVSAKVADISIQVDFGQKRIAFPMKLLSEVQLQTRTCVS